MSLETVKATGSYILRTIIYSYTKYELEHKAARRIFSVYTPQLHKRLEISHSRLTGPDDIRKTKVLWMKSVGFFHAVHRFFKQIYKSFFSKIYCKSRQMPLCTLWNTAQATWGVFCTVQNKNLPQINKKSEFASFSAWTGMCSPGGWGRKLF